MADLPRRNVHVFSSSNGTEVAGEFLCTSGCLPAPLLKKTLYRKASSSTEAFQYPRSSVGSRKSATFPSNGLFTRANAMTLVPSVARHLILAVRTIFNLGATSYALCLLVRVLSLSLFIYFSVAGWLMTIVIESAQVSVYLTTDVARTRKYSDNHPHTAHVRFSFWKHNFLLTSGIRR